MQLSVQELQERCESKGLDFWKIYYSIVLVNQSVNQNNTTQKISTIYGNLNKQEKAMVVDNISKMSYLM